MLEICYRLKFKELFSYINFIKREISVNCSERLMGWDDIRACVKNGVEIGSHSSWHYNLEMIDDEKFLINDISNSRKRIYDETGIYTNIFAFPSGKYNKKVVRNLQDLDFKIILICGEKTNRMNLNDSSGFSVYSRINIGIRSIHEEKLRCLGFHEKARSII